MAVKVFFNFRRSIQHDTTRDEKGVKKGREEKTELPKYLELV